MGKIGIVAAAFLILMGGTTLAAPGGGGGTGGGPPDGVGGGGPPNGGGETTAGNNLSFPVIWSDGVTKSLPGTFGVTVYGGDPWYVWTEGGVEMSCEVSDTTCTPGADAEIVYLQQDPANSWRAEEFTPEDPLDVDWIDWGDNLEARSWTTNSQVRVETVLYQGVGPMAYFDMRHVYGQGVGEMWGATEESLEAAALGSPMTLNEATVYSGCARLTIQALTKLRESADLTLEWDPLAGQWKGDALPPVFNGGVWQAGDGPGYYSAEINIPGKVIYGYNWNVKTMSNGPGDYRITFSLDELNCTEELNTFFTSGVTEVVPKEEEEEVSITEEPDLAGGITGIDYENNLTYIDVRIEGQGGGGGRGSNSAGGGGRR